MSYRGRDSGGGWGNSGSQLFLGLGSLGVAPKGSETGRWLLTGEYIVRVKT